MKSETRLVLASLSVHPLGKHSQSFEDSLCLQKAILYQKICTSTLEAACYTCWHFALVTIRIRRFMTKQAHVVKITCFSRLDDPACYTAFQPRKVVKKVARMPPSQFASSTAQTEPMFPGYITWQLGKLQFSSGFSVKMSAT